MSDINKTKKDFKIYIFIIILVALISSGFYLLEYLKITKTKDYDLAVDALKEEQSLFTHTRAQITNTGKLPLTNVMIDYGNKTQIIDILEPGERFPLNPPSGSNLDRIIITTNEGINVTKDYRTPIKMPGMMGS